MVNRLRWSVRVQTKDHACRNEFLVVGAEIYLVIDKIINVDIKRLCIAE